MDIRLSAELADRLGVEAAAGEFRETVPLFSWTAEAIPLDGGEALLVVNEASGLTALVADMTDWHWERFDELVRELVGIALGETGLDVAGVLRYLDLAGDMHLTGSVGDSSPLVRLMATRARERPVDHGSNYQAETCLHLNEDLALGAGRLGEADATPGKLMRRKLVEADLVGGDNSGLRRESFE